MHTWMTRNMWWLRLIAYIILTIAVIYTSTRTFQLANENRNALQKIEQESTERRDQVCLSAEREHLTNVNRLRNTYAYLSELSPKKLEAAKLGKASKATLNNFILAQLPQTESQARIDVAPEFCDQPGIGLPEPDPVVPRRPSFLDKYVLQPESREPQDLRNPDQRG